ncbi:MAG: hypothetical protein QNK03_22710 [Myxococcota bacterium]|nr:hypothetical protein [Myxococcota bacterium]
MRVQRDLESLGVSAAFSAPVAARIAGLRPELGEDTYSAVLDGVTVAFDAHRSHCDSLAGRVQDIDEIERLMKGFAGELRKLEEGLRIVSAYVTRMHTKAGTERERLLH